ncbi:MAG: conjugal transfer protein [Nocardioides sp.]
MSPNLTLRRPKKTHVADDPILGADEGAEDLPPVADGRHQATSALAAKAAPAGLLTCLVLGPIGAVAGALALAQSGQSAPAAVVTATDQANERAVVGQFAQQVVVTWLTTTQDKPDALLALVKDAQVSTLSQTPFVVVDPGVAGIVDVNGVWSVTVAATVTDARKSTTRRYFQIPVRFDRGSVAALTLPAPVAAPPVSDGDSRGYRAQIDTTTALGQSVAQFLTAYVAGSGDVSRYLTPGVSLVPLSPAPYTSVQVSEIRVEGSEQPAASTPQDGTRVRVLVLATATVTTKQTSSVTYALTLTARAGRWEITAIDPAPSQPTHTPDAPSAPEPEPAEPSAGSSTPTGSIPPATPTP